MGSPLWNLRPGRSLNSYERPSALSRHDSARLGPILLPGSGRTIASWMAYSMPNGVICGGAVDGSNQLGASVTCHAITASPGWAAPAEFTASASSSAVTSEAIPSRWRLIRSPQFRGAPRPAGPQPRDGLRRAQRRSAHVFVVVLEGHVDQGLP